MDVAPPSVLLLDGDFDNTLVIARELTEDLDATIIGAGTSPYSRLLHSTYCDVTCSLPPPGDPTYAAELLALIEAHRPDVVLPVGYDSIAELDAIRSDIPAAVSLCVPSSASFGVAEDKAATLECGSRLGLDTPREYSNIVEDLDADGRSTSRLETLPFPLFCKARTENGTVTTAPVIEPDQFWETYDRIAAASPGNDVLVQEYVDDSRSTYGCGLLFFENEVVLLFSHEELRSVPRWGGSGTHLRVLRDPHLEAASIRLLRDIGWHGVALVEFKRRADGTYVLMEINPKFWASYALASRYGYRFASTLVATTLELDIPHPIGSPAPVGEMAFPLRELQYHLEQREVATLGDTLRTVLTPGAAWDVDEQDLVAWLMPPVGLANKLTVPDVGELLSAATSMSPPSRNSEEYEEPRPERPHHTRTGRESNEYTRNGEPNDSTRYGKPNDGTGYGKSNDSMPYGESNDGTRYGESIEDGRYE